MAYVLTSISGNLISAASAGSAPTNSADVSAIASAYQVVSSTSTQLYAGTAFLTEVNGAPVSASRAGNAANAGMANSAYYDGTGRLISSLPDSAAVSSIASSYAESAASGKLDSSASSSFYTVDNPSGFITGVDLGEYATTGYVDSAVSGKADSSALSSYALSSDVSGVIDTVSTNSASWGGGATGDYVEKSAMEVAIGSGNDVSATSFAFGVDNSANSAGVAFGRSNYASASSLAVGYGSTASSRSFAFGSNSTAGTRSMAFGANASANEGSLAFGSTCKASMDSYVFGSQPTATDYSFAFGNHSIATNTSVAEGYYVSAHSGAVAFGKYNLHGNGHTGSGDSAAFVIGDGTGSTARHDLMLVTKDGEITMYSSTADTVGTGIMSSIRAISAAATGGGVDSATVSAIASSYVESGVSSKLDTSAQVVTSIESSDYQYEGSWVTGVKGINGNFLAALYRVDGEELASQGDISGVIDTVSSNSATWGQGGVDSATVSAIASAYVESGVSSKLDTTAFNSGDFYSTSNPSSFVDSAYVDSAVSGKADSSALSSYVPYSSLEYNTASAISGINGSALAAGSTYSAGEGIDITDDVISVEAPVDIVAGPGIVIDNPDGNTLRVSTNANYETVLWSGTYSGSVSDSNYITLSENPANFDTVEITIGGGYKSRFRFAGNSTTWSFMQSYANTSSTTIYAARFDRSATTVTCKAANYMQIGANQVNSWQNRDMNVGELQITQVVGIHRTASN